MITIRTAAAYTAGVIAVILLTSCSGAGDADTASSRPTTTYSSETVVTTSSTSPSPAANDATTEACRALADDEDLAEFWHQVNNSPTVTGALAMRATMAVMRLGKYTPNSAVDPAVASAMTTAITETGNMNQEIAGGAQFDIERFRQIITPVVTTCQDAGVDMSIPE